MRALAESASKNLGVPIIVENKGGAGGTLGANELVNAKPDGYTLSQLPHGVFRIPHMQKVQFDVLKDFTWIACLTGYTFGLVVPVSSPIKSIKDLVDYAKANPERFTYGHTGIGTSPHLAVEEFAQRAGIKLTHVPFKGNADAQLALQSGDIQLLSDAIPGAIGPVKAGKVKAIGIADQRRSPFLPDLPTVAEQGLQGVVAVGWIGLSAPAKTPEPILDKLSAEIMRILKEPEVLEKMKGLAFVPAKESRQEFEAYIAIENMKWQKVVTDAGVKIE
jgi:tripartite-type tricarboxylate transporter receptor subunit TctC